MATRVMSPAEREYKTLKDAYDNAVALTQTDTKKVVILNFKSLQLLRIKALQQELFSMQLRFMLGGFTPEEYPSKLEHLDSTLHSYGKALSTYEVLAQNTLSAIPEGSSLFGAPEELIEKKEHSNTKVKPTLLDYIKRKPRHRPPKIYYAVKDWTQFTHFRAGAVGGDYLLNGSLLYRELDDAGREARAEKKGVTERFSMALFGGVALMGPVLIMTLRPGRDISLITTSIAIILFALMLAFWARSTSGKDILAATAAYAAVLVVFIGTSSPSAPVPLN